MKRLLIAPDEKLSIRDQCQLLNLNRASFYYQPKGEKPENLEIMRLMDEYILEEPTAGVKTMQYMLRDKGYQPGYERVRRLMRKANIRAIYPRRHLTVLSEKKYVHPYLLRDLVIERPNQAWEVDITYVPMQSGFMYLTAVIDVYSRMIVGWGLANTLDALASLEVIKQAVETHGCPEILNSDQGSQFTCKEYVEYLKGEKIKVSMDGKGHRGAEGHWITFISSGFGVPLSTATFICFLKGMASHCTRGSPTGWKSTTIGPTRE